MLLNTYEKVIKMFQDGKGYRNAAELKEARITTVQIKELVDKDILERVSHGYYWLKGNEKPKDYQMIEACMVNPRAVICADTACYYHGLLEEPPAKTSIATLKTDRSKMQLNFPVSRHYYSDLTFEEDLLEVDTEFGSFRIYDVDRSVCDAIRFREDIGEEKVTEIIRNYLKREHKQIERVFAYADAMRVGKIVRTKIEEETE